MNQAGDTDLRQDLSFVYRIRRRRWPAATRRWSSCTAPGVDENDDDAARHEHRAEGDLDRRARARHAEKAPPLVHPHHADALRGKAAFAPRCAFRGSVSPLRRAGRSRRTRCEKAVFIGYSNGASTC